MDTFCANLKSLRSNWGEWLRTHQNTIITEGFLFFIPVSVQLCICQVGTQSLLARKTTSVEMTLTSDVLETRLRYLKKNRKQAWKPNTKSIWRLSPPLASAQSRHLGCSAIAEKHTNLRENILGSGFTASISTSMNAIRKGWISFLVLVRLGDFLFTIIFSFI